MGSIPTRGDEIFIYIYIFISSLWCREENATLSSAIQHAMWGTECLNTRPPSAYPAVCGIQRETEKKRKNLLKLCIQFLWVTTKLKINSFHIYLFSTYIRQSHQYIEVNLNKWWSTCNLFVILFTGYSVNLKKTKYGVKFHN